MAHELLNVCLVDGDSEQRKREKKIRRRALAISITLQVAALAVLLLMPLLGKPAAILVKDFVPVPPYYAHRQQPQVAPATPVRRQHIDSHAFVEPRYIPRTINMNPTPPEPVGEPAQIPGGIDVPGAIPITNAQPTAQPLPPPTQARTPSILHFSHIDASKLVSRIEPTYPVLAKQIGRSGKVELHAIIGEDGMIQSLEAVGGDPMFFSSAMQAVKQWRYTPTLLNGQAVKVDTYITVIYNIAR